MHALLRRGQRPPKAPAPLLGPAGCRGLDAAADGCCPVLHCLLIRRFQHQPPRRPLAAALGGAAKGEDLEAVQPHAQAGQPAAGLGPATLC